MPEMVRAEGSQRTSQLSARAKVAWVMASTMCFALAWLTTIPDSRLASALWILSLLCSARILVAHVLADLRHRRAHFGARVIALGLMVFAVISGRLAVAAGILLGVSALDVALSLVRRHSRREET